MNQKIISTFFIFVILAMLAVTGWASSTEGVIPAILRLVHEPWVVATLFDAYFGFLIFFLWLCYKEVSSFKRAVWFVLIMLLGNIAMAFYVLLEIKRIKNYFTIEKLISEKKPV